MNKNPDPKTYKYEKGQYKLLHDSWLISGMRNHEINKSQVLDIIEIKRTPQRIEGYVAAIDGIQVEDGSCNHETIEF